MSNLQTFFKSAAPRRVAVPAGATPPPGAQPAATSTTPALLYGTAPGSSYGKGTPERDIMRSAVRGEIPLHQVPAPMQQDVIARQGNRELAANRQSMAGVKPDAQNSAESIAKTKSDQNALTHASTDRALTNNPYHPALPEDYNHGQAMARANFAVKNKGWLQHAPVAGALAGGLINGLMADESKGESFLGQAAKGAIAGGGTGLAAKHLLPHAVGMMHNPAPAPPVPGT